MVCYAESVVVNHGVLCRVSGYESRSVKLSQWLLIMVCYAEQVVVVIFLSRGCHTTL
jgi:hypothetical protein